MAVETVTRLPFTHLSQCPSPPLRHVSTRHSAFAAVLRDIPAAAQAMRRARASRPQPPPTVFLLDWDDTCCATTYLERCGVMADLDTRLEECAPQLDRYLRLLEHRVLSLLKSAVNLGTVLIVTNAGDGWVELSSSRFLPAVRAFLDANYKRIKIVSARARYLETHRQYPLQWKVLTFSDELQTILASSPFHPHQLHVVVLGDSIGDQYAAHVASDALASAGMPVVLKVVKFLERPTIDQLCKELAVLLDHLLVMTFHNGPFDVSMYKEPTSQNEGHLGHPQSAPPSLSSQRPSAASDARMSTHSTTSTISPTSASNKAGTSSMSSPASSTSPLPGSMLGEGTRGGVGGVPSVKACAAAV